MKAPFTRVGPAALVLVLLCLPAGPAAARLPRPGTTAPGDSMSAPTGPGGPAADASVARIERLVGLGLENVACADPGTSTRVAYENRRWRHSADALGRVENVLDATVMAFEERLGLVAASLHRESEPGAEKVELELPPGAPSLTSGILRTIEGPERTRFRVLYPCDPGFPRPPGGPRARPTSRSVDLVVGPLFDYELGRILDPVLYRIQIQPMLRYTPWPGALARLALVIPVHNRFKPDPLHPDVDRVRPGPLDLQQFAWLPNAGLLSLDGGYFGENRYGGSVGIARPIAGGRFLLDAQGDLTGFISFGPNGTEYSKPSHWTGFGAIIWRPGLDISVRARAARFLFGDRGQELEVRRVFGDTEIAFFGQHTPGDNVVGVRLVLPVPPPVRSNGRPLRVQPVERFSIDYHSRSNPVGRDLMGVASRTDYLRQLDEPSLNANLGRFAQAGGRLRAEEAHAPGSQSAPDLMNLSGVTGFVNTPWAGVVADRRLEVGYNHVPRKWAWDNRGRHDNEVYYATLGFLPRTEASIRWTVIPGLRSFEDIAPESELTDTDYMASGRLCLVEPRPLRPGLALGVEDVRGTRRFHSTYGVAGLPLRIAQMHGRVSLGYAFKALKAGRRTLLGTFGAVEWFPWRLLVMQVEYDTEKWNLGLAAPAPYGIRFRAALLDMESLSVGVGFGHAL